MGDTKIMLDIIVCAMCEVPTQVRQGSDVGGYRPFTDGFFACSPSKVSGPVSGIFFDVIVMEVVSGVNPLLWSWGASASWMKLSFILFLKYNLI